MGDYIDRPLVLCVAEKPSLALSIASFLSDGKHVTRRGHLDVHEFTRHHEGRACDFRVTAVTGHVLSIDFPTRFQSWDVDPATLFDAPVVKKEASRGSRVVEHLETSARGARQLILWLDCDREGENICFEVMDACGPVMRSDAETFANPIRRAKFSAVTKQSIETAMRTLTDPDVNQARAVDARQELDLKIGVAFTRFQTNHFRDKFSGLDSKVVSYGPCQTPTLGFVVERHLDIARFSPEPFWSVAVDAELGPERRDENENRMKPPTATDETDARAALRAIPEPSSRWRRGRVFDARIAEAYMEIVSEGVSRNGGFARVVSVTSKEVRKPPPPGLNTVDLLKSASAGMGMGAHRAMQVAESLYIAGFISYPRTESNAFPEGFDFKETLSQCRGHPELGDSMVAEMLGEEASAATSRGAKSSHAFRTPRGGFDAGDHPPITPASVARSPEDVGGMDAWRLYDFVARRFIAACAEDAVVFSREVHLEIDGEVFEVTGSETHARGWTEALPWRASVDVFLRPVKEGDLVKVTSVTLRSALTSPPRPLTESELIGLMESHGIGTDASIPTHINNIEKRRYVTIDTKGREVNPTVLGATLVNGYVAVDPELVAPETRNKLEKQLDAVARGEADHGAVVAHALRQFSKKFAHFVKHVDAIDALFEAKFDPRAAGSADAAPFSKCGRCLRYLRLTKTRTPRLTCPFEDVSYALPPGALVSKFDGRQCPLCGFEVLACGYGGDIAFPLCPFCYARPPSGRLETDPRSPQPFSCPHPPSHPVVDAFAVRPCPSCEAERAGRASGEGVVVGWLITELLPRGKKGASVRKVHCTACETTLRLPPSVKECRPTRFSCGGCGHRCVEVKYDEETTPLAGGETRHVACVACEDLLHHQSVLVKVPRRRGEAKDGRRDRERRR